MESKKIIAAFLVSCFLLSGCSSKKEEPTAESTTETTVETESSVTDETTESSESETETEATISRDGWVDDGDGSQFISKCDPKDADKFQNGGYIPLKPEDVNDPGVREYAEKLYAKGYSLCSLEYLGYAMAGCGLIVPEEGSTEYRFFNYGISAELLVNDGVGDVLTNEYYFIRMTEEQFNTIMLYQSNVNLYIYGQDFSPVPKDFAIPEGTDDGIVRRITSDKGHYIEYHRDTGICVIYIDHTKIDDWETEPIDDDKLTDKKDANN